nr:MAG TPA: hypothetical protein [Caudoviricetes sp.]
MFIPHLFNTLYYFKNRSIRLTRCVKYFISSKFF